MVLPATLLLVVFILWPLITAASYSTTSASGYGDRNPVGLANFAEAFSDTDLYLAFGRNVLLASIVVVGTLVVAFCTAYFLFLKVAGWKVLQGAFMAPYILPAVVAGLLWQFLLEPEAGLVNSVLRAIGLGGLAGPWLTGTESALMTVGMIEIWKTVPFAMLLLFAGMVALPPETLEAAELDGANHRIRMFRIVFPMIRPTVVLVGVLLTVNLFRSFDLVYLLTRGGPLGSTTVATLYVYVEAFQNNRYGYANALGIVIGVFLVILAIATRLISRRLTSRVKSPAMESI